MTSVRPGLDEFGIIAEVLAPLAEGNAGAFSLTDDAAALSLAPEHELIVTKDALVADVHFFAAVDAAHLARKALRVNLSDLAAMGAEPLGYLLALMLPRDIEPVWLNRFADGLREDQGEFGISLLGGDLVATDGPLSLTVTALGQVPRGAALRRAGARNGDVVFVSGTIGDGALGLEAARDGLAGLTAEQRSYLVGRYELPLPRLALGSRLRGLVHATIDVSDGLVADLGHVCEVSGCGAEIEAAKVPLSAPARAVLAAEPERLADVLTGGDDYELLFAAAEENEGAVATLAADIDLPLTAIGRFTEGDRVRVLDAEGGELNLDAGGYRHF